ncbi:hypothetical protein H0H93_013730 [Arthromyces matolae]|nr:hypothetical protein H0H93_013730 [Arthromyces matolae]
MSLPPRFIDLKREIVDLYPNFKERAIQAWGEIIAQLKEVNAEIAKTGPNYIPQVNFADLEKLEPEEIDKIKRRGSVVIKDVVPDEEAVGWKLQLKEFVQANPDVEASAWLNNLYHAKKSDQPSQGVDLSTPLTYADRFRIRRPGLWEMHPPHVDGGTIERWEDPAFRQCFSDILSGNWRSHDPYELKGRLDASTSRYNRPNQVNMSYAAQAETFLTIGKV